MASIIRIKRSNTAGNPSTLGTGELAYSALTDNGSNGGDRLYIGIGPETAGNAVNHLVIGGKFFTDRLDHTAGTLTASSAIVVDADSKINDIKVGNLELTGNTLSSTNTDGNIVLTPNGDGYVSISGTNALVIPKGTSAQQAPAVTAAIRFNTDNTAFEGYNGTNWTSLGGVKSVDQNTYVTASNNGNIDFFSDTTNVVTVDGDGIKIKTTTTASGSNTGALQVAGGVSIEGALYVQGALTTTGNQNSDAFLAANGAPSGTGTTGFSFQSDSGYDTGMFSAGDGQLSLYSNNNEILYLNGTSDSYLKTPTLHLGTNYGTITANTNDIVINPNSDDDYSRLHIASWLVTGNINLYNNGNAGLTLGNADNSDSSIDIGGSASSWYSGAPDDISLFAQRNGVINLRTNNGDIKLLNDSGQVTFLNSNGHLQIPGTIETSSSTGDIILVASDGTDKALIFKQDGSLTLPSVGINFFNANNIGGTQVAALDFDGSDMYLDNFNGAITLWANDNAGWRFSNDNNGTLTLPHGAILADGTNNSLLFGFNVQQTGSSQRVVIGYQPDTQTGESWDAIAIGSRAGTTNQGNNAIAMGNRAGNSGQGNDSIAIGSSPNSSVGGAGYLNQGSYAVAIGAQAAESNQQSGAVALGNLAGQTSQGYHSVAIGPGAGQTSQTDNAVAIGANAGNNSQGLTSIAIGQDAGSTYQDFSAIAIGRWAGDQYQGQKAVAIGRLAGRYNQGGWAVAIGHHAGMGVFDNTSQGTNAIAIGAHAGEYSQHANSIVLQATANGNGTGINPDQAGLFIDPIRNVNSGSQYVIYNSDTKEVTYNATNIEISGSTITATNAGTDANVVLEPIGAGHVSASNAQIKHVAEPTDDNDAATKYYVDAARSGLDVKASVRLATTEDISLTGVQTIDTQTTVTGDRILVKDQDLAKNNGIYVANDTGAWTRATDFDNLANDLTTPLAGEVTGGAFVFVEDGSTNLNTGFVLTNKGEPVLGTDALNWTLFSASGTLIAGDGLSKSGYTLAVNVDSNGGLEINSDSLRLKSSVAGNGLSLYNGVISVGTTNPDRITIGATSIDIASTYAGQSSITTLGTITSGTWQGNTIGSGYGGTGFTGYAKGDLIYASDTDTLSKLAGGDTGKVLQMNSSGVPVWGDIDGGTY